MTEKQLKEVNKWLDKNYYSKCCKDIVRVVGKVISFYQCQKCNLKCALEEKHKKIL